MKNKANNIKTYSLEKYNYFNVFKIRLFLFSLKELKPHYLKGKYGAFIEKLLYRHGKASNSNKTMKHNKHIL